MKGFFCWFKQKTKMKRWLVLMLIGILLCCYGMATILTSKQMAFGSVAKIIAIFVVGFICVIVSVVSIQRRTLELLVTDTDNRAKEDESKVKSLIYNKKVYHQGPKIVAIGGGAGLNAVLKGVKKYTDNITAIVTVSDYGEAKTDSRKILETLPLNDVKDSLIALAENEEQMGKLLNYNFTNGQLRNLCFGDIYLHAMNRVCGDFTESIKQSDQILKELRKLETEMASKEKHKKIEALKKELSDSMGDLQPSVKSMIVPKVSSKEIKDLKPGDDVKVVTLNQEGSVVSVDNKKKEAVVQIGIMKMNLPFKSLKKIPKDKKSTVTKQTRKIISEKSGRVKGEVDLRGLNLEEAIIEMDKYLDDACVAGLETVTIIHGIGTGVLKKGLQDVLKRNKHVKSKRPGEYGEGGAGVTIVTLR